MEVEERETSAGAAAELAAWYESEDEAAAMNDIEVFNVTDQEARDTSAEEHKRGKDMQGIPWQLLNFSRKEFRDDRVRQYENYLNLGEHVRENKSKLESEVATVSQTGQYFDFLLNQRSVHATVVHFQLRNLLWPTSNHDVFLSQQERGDQGGSILHWNLADQRSAKVLDLTGNPLDQSGQDRPAATSSLAPVSISTGCVAHDLVAIGGFNGELVAMSLAVERPVASVRVSHTDNSITNGVEVFRGASGASSMLVSNNDLLVRLFDVERMACTGSIALDWAANYSVACPSDPKLAGIVGDCPEALLWDSGSNKVVAELEGHLDYSFAAAWHPDGNLLATGNQDCCTRLWDKRKLGQSLSVLRGCMGAIRSLRFSADGCFLAMAEPADFVHIFDTRSGYTKSQLVDVFGDIAGIGFSPMTDTFFAAISLEDYSSLLTLTRRRNWSSINSRLS